VTVTVCPAASIHYRGEGKIWPQSYANQFGGETSPLYRVEIVPRRNSPDYWSMTLWHTGAFGGGDYGTEQIPDRRTGGLYQSNRLNVGFTNLFVTRHLPLESVPANVLFHVSIVREIFKRDQFAVQGPSGWVTTGPSGNDDTNEISAEGIGLGLEGEHGDRLYARWATSANYYVMLFDAKTDSSAGHIFQAEAGVGYRPVPAFSIELGALWQYWFIPSQGERRLSVPGTDGAVISWNRQETRTQGFYVRSTYRY